jgi:hypothetical protein
MLPDQFVDTGFVYRPIGRVCPTVSSKTSMPIYTSAAKSAKP